MALTKATYSMIAGASINVLDYGVVGDGTTNDTAAFQDAIDAAATTNQSVFVPAGTYYLTDTLNMPTVTSEGGGLVMIGEGLGSILKFNTTNDCIKVPAGALFQNYQLQFIGLTFKSVTSVPRSFIWNDRAVNTIIERCNFLDSEVDVACIINDNAYGLTVRNCVFLQITGTCIYLGSAPDLSTYSYVISIEDCDMSTVTIGVAIAGTSDFQMVNTVIQEADYGIYADPVASNDQAFNMTLDNCWFERNATYDIYLNSNADNWCEGTIRNCQFNPEVGSTGKINLVQKSKVTIEGINGGNQCVVYGSNDAAAILIKATNFNQSGSFSWTVIDQTEIQSPLFVTQSGSDANTPNNTPTTLVTLPNVAAGAWLVTAALPANSPTNYAAVSLVTTQTTNTAITPIKTAANMVLTVSGLNVQGTQTSGGPYGIDWTIVRIA